MSDRKLASGIDPPREMYDNDSHYMESSNSKNPFENEGQQQGRPIESADQQVSTKGFREQHRHRMHRMGRFFTGRERSDMLGNHKPVTAGALKDRHHKEESGDDTESALLGQEFSPDSRLRTALDKFHRLRRFALGVDQKLQVEYPQTINDFAHSEDGRQVFSWWYMVSERFAQTTIPHLEYQVAQPGQRGTYREYAEAIACINDTIKILEDELIERLY